MDIKELKNIDVLLKMINSDLQTKHSYKIVCRYKESLVTIDFVLPFQWNDEFYCYEPKTINSRQDDKEKSVYRIKFSIPSNERYFKI